MSVKVTADNEPYVPFPFYQTIQILGAHAVDRRLWGKQKPTPVCTTPYGTFF